MNYEREVADIVLSRDQEFLKWLLVDAGLRLKKEGYRFIPLSSYELLETHLTTVPAGYRFRLWIHAELFKGTPVGVLGPKEISRELLKDFPFVKFQFMTRDVEQKFGESTAYQIMDVALGKYPIGEFPINVIPGRTSKKTVNAGISDSQKSSIDFAVLTALYDKELEVYERPCYFFDSDVVYNSRYAKFKEPANLPHGKDYDQRFLLIHQEQKGLVDAAIHATQTISNVDPTFLLMSGVCGGREGEVNQYDVIIPTTVHDYATGKFKSGKLESLQYESAARKDLVTFLKKVTPKIILNMKTLIDPARKDLLSETFKIVIDEFACGPWVVKTSGFLTEYLVNAVSENIKGLEMESYSILRTGEVIQRDGRYSLIVKSVMDFTNESKSDGEFGEKKSSAAYVSYLCVRAMMPFLLEFKENVSKWKPSTSK